MEKINKWLSKLLLVFILLYRYLLSPVLGNHCKFYPSCSCYAKTAIERFGIFRGMYLTMVRIFSCHPWHEGGFDPVPEKHVR